jgi:hypothetical protein
MSRGMQNLRAKTRTDRRRCSFHQWPRRCSPRRRCSIQQAMRDGDSFHRPISTERAIDKGVTLAVVSGRIKGRGARPDPAFLAELRAHEAEIVALLSTPPLLTNSPSASPWPPTASPSVISTAGRGSNLNARSAWTSFAGVGRPTDAGLFLDQWSAVADAFGWTLGDVFDFPRDGLLGGLVWWLRGEGARSLGSEHAVTKSGKVYDWVAQPGRRA